MHSLLKRQLKRFFGHANHVPQELLDFIKAIDHAYHEFDTDRAMLERSLELSSHEMMQMNAEMQAILSALPDVIFRIDSSGTILDCQAGNSEEFYLFPKNKMLGKKIQSVNYQQVGKQFQKAIRTVLKKNAVVSMEYILSMNDEINHYEARLVPFLDHQIIVIIRNITDRVKADDAIRKTEERFRVLIEKASDLITIIDINGVILYQSPSSESILGYRAEELVGQNAIDYIHPEDVPTVQSTLFPDSGYTPVDIVEIRFHRKDGSWRYLEVVGRDLRDQPEIGAILINARDITERKQAEEAQKRSESLYRTIFENTGTAMLMFDQNEYIVLANKKALELTGAASQDHLVNKHWSHFVTEESLCTIVDFSLSMGIKAVNAKRTYELQIIREDGQIRDVFITVDFIPGTYWRIASVLDLTEIKEAQRALQESEEKYRVLIENATDGIFIIQDNVIKFPNRNTIDATGYSEEELARMPFTDLVHPDDLEGAMIDFNKQLLKKSATRPISFRIITKAGDELWAEVVAVPTIWKNRRAVINFVRDITQQRKLENQLLQAQKMEAVGTLAGGIAHDFNNLLMGIQGYASIMLMDDDRSVSDAEMLKAIEHQVRSGTDLTKQLLGFARAGKYETKPTNLNELLQKTSSIFGRTRKEVTIYTNFTDDVWTIDVDRGQIEQCLINLYVNAWQAMPGGGDISLETHNIIIDEISAEHLNIIPGQYVRLSVTDTGIGMDPNTQARIFEPFFTTKEMGRGTGLGLASVYGIIKNHKGTINVYSKKGHGTTFNIYLPVSVKVLSEEGVAQSRLLRGEETILVVDDEKIAADVTDKILSKLGYKVITAPSGKKALQLYKKKRAEIDLVILDMIMPEMNGEQTFSGLKALNADVKILLASGYSMNQNVSRILEQGGLDFIQKPFDVNELSVKLRKILDNP